MCWLSRQLFFRLSCTNVRETGRYEHNKNRNSVPSVEMCLKKGDVPETWWSPTGTVLQQNTGKPCHLSTVLTLARPQEEGFIVWISTPGFCTHSAVKKWVNTSYQYFTVICGHWDPLKFSMEFFPHDRCCMWTGWRNCSCLEVVTQCLMLQLTAFNWLRWTVTCPQTFFFMFVLLFYFIFLFKHWAHIST